MLQFSNRLQINRTEPRCDGDKKINKTEEVKNIEGVKIEVEDERANEKIWMEGQGIKEKGNNGDEGEKCLMVEPKTEGEAGTIKCVNTDIVSMLLSLHKSKFFVFVPFS